MARFHQISIPIINSQSFWVVEQHIDSEEAINSPAENSNGNARRVCEQQDRLALPLINQHNHPAIQLPKHIQRCQKLQSSENTVLLPVSCRSFLPTNINSCGLSTDHSKSARGNIALPTKFGSHSQHQSQSLLSSQIQKQTQPHMFHSLNHLNRQPTQLKNLSYETTRTRKDHNSKYTSDHILAASYQPIRSFSDKSIVQQYSDDDLNSDLSEPAKELANLNQQAATTVVTARMPNRTLEPSVKNRSIEELIQRWTKQMKRRKPVWRDWRKREDDHSQQSMMPITQAELTFQKSSPH